MRAVALGSRYKPAQPNPSALVTSPVPRRVTDGTTTTKRISEPNRRGAIVRAVEDLLSKLRFC